jgi:drug/metabolite transporter (DMT)-like permease
VVGGTLWVTPDSLFIQMAQDVVHFEYIFYKFLLVGLTLLVSLVASEGLNSWHVMKSIGKVGIIAGMIWSIFNFSVNYALQLIDTATVLVIMAANPMFSALGTYFLLKEKIPLRTIVTGIVCFLSILIIVSSELGSGNKNALGLFFALMSSISMGSFFVALRYAAVCTG